MAEEAKLVSKIRGLNVDVIYGSDNEETQYELTGQAEQLVAHSAAQHSENVRLGRSFWVNTAAEITAVIAMPTTACGFALYNGEADGGRSYIIDQVWALYTAAPAALYQAGIVACLSQVRETPIANALSATVTIKTLNGSGKSDTRARVILTATALPATTGFAGNWMQIGDMTEAAITSLPGCQQVHDVQGRYVVQPGRFFALHVVASAVGVHAQLGIAWTERYLLNG
jgi:hypothetical protein